MEKINPLHSPEKNMSPDNHPFYIGQENININHTPKAEAPAPVTTKVGSVVTQNFDREKLIKFSQEYSSHRELRHLYAKMIKLAKNEDEKRTYEEKLESVPYKIEALKGFAETYPSVEVEDTRNGTKSKDLHKKHINLAMLAVAVDEARGALDQARTPEEKKVAHIVWLKAVINLTEGEELIGQAIEGREK